MTVSGDQTNPRMILEDSTVLRFPLFSCQPGTGRPPLAARTSSTAEYDGQAFRGLATTLAAAFQDEHPVVAVSRLARRIKFVHSCRGHLAGRRA